MARVVVIVKIECSSANSGGLDGDAEIHFSLKYPGMARFEPVVVPGKYGDEGADLGAKFDKALKAADAKSQQSGPKKHGPAMSAGRTGTTSSHSTEFKGYGKNADGSLNLKEVLTNEYLKIEFDDIESIDAESDGHGKVEIIVIEDSAPPERPSLIVVPGDKKAGWKPARSVLEECKEYRERKAERKRKQKPGQDGVKQRMAKEEADPWFWFCDKIVSWRAINASLGPSFPRLALNVAELLVSTESLPHLPAQQFFEWTTSVPTRIPFAVYDSTSMQIAEMRTRLEQTGYLARRARGGELVVERAGAPNGGRSVESAVRALGLRCGASEFGGSHAMPWNFILGSEFSIANHAGSSAATRVLLPIGQSPGAVLGKFWGRRAQERVHDAPWIRDGARTHELESD